MALATGYCRRLRKATTTNHTTSRYVRIKSNLVFLGSFQPKLAPDNDGIGSLAAYLRLRYGQDQRDVGDSAAFTSLSISLSSTSL